MLTKMKEIKYKRQKKTRKLKNIKGEVKFLHYHWLRSHDKNCLCLRLQTVDSQLDVRLNVKILM